MNESKLDLDIDNYTIKELLNVYKLEKLHLYDKILSPFDRASLAKSLYFSINFEALWLFLPGAFLLKLSLLEKFDPNLGLSPFDLKFLSFLLKLFLLLLLLLFLNVTMISKKLYFCTDYTSIIISKIFVDTVNNKKQVQRRYQ